MQKGSLETEMYQLDFSFIEATEKKGYNVTLE